MANILSHEVQNPTSNGSDDIVTVPACDPVEDAMRKYVLPVGWERCRVPKKTPTRSKIYDYGVRLQSLTEKDKFGHPVQQWVCLANSTCRGKNDGKGCSIKISPSSTSAAIDYIKSFHDSTPSALTVKKTKRKVESEIKIQASRELMTTLKGL